MMFFATCHIKLQNLFMDGFKNNVRARHKRKKMANAFGA